jgi:hypothetical protein
VSQSSSRRKYLNIVIVMCLLIIVVGFTPTIRQRLSALPGQKESRTMTTDLDPSDGVQGSVPAGSREVDLLPPAGGYGEIPLPDAERIVQQAQLIRGELAARERAIAAQEDLLRRQVLAEFWKRQAAAAAATLGLSLIIVLVLVRRAADWSGFSQRLREEESRMRNLQLSVIGALEEFESELAAARSWAAAEARSRRPVADRSSASEPADRPAESVALSASPASTSQAVFSARPATARGSASASSVGFFFGEGEHVGAAVPMGSSDQRRLSGEPEPATPFEAAPGSVGTGESPEAAPWDANAEPVAQRSEARVSAAPSIECGSAFQEPWQPAQGAAARMESPQVQEGPQSWARRFLAPEVAETSSPSLPSGPSGSSGPGAAAGPWVEPVRREAPMPGPKNSPRFGNGGPSTREQVERLTSEGWSETEIARRLGLSREEIHLALMLGRSARADVPVDSPYGRGPNAGWSGTVPAPGWQPRDRVPEGIGER